MLYSRNYKVITMSRKYFERDHSTDFRLRYATSDADKFNKHGIDKNFLLTMVSLLHRFSSLTEEDVSFPCFTDFFDSEDRQRFEH